MNVRVDQARQQRAAIHVDDSGPGASRRAAMENIDDDAVVDCDTTAERRVARSRDDHPVGELQGLAHPLIPIGEDCDRQVLDSPWAFCHHSCEAADELIPASPSDDSSPAAVALAAAVHRLARQRWAGTDR